MNLSFLKRVFILACVLSLAALSACSVQVRNGLEEDYVSSSGWSNTSNGSEASWSEGSSSNSGVALVEEQQMVNPAEGINALEVANTAGNIKIVRADSGQIDIKATKKVRGLNEEEKRKIMDNIDIRVEKLGQTLRIRAVSRDSDGTDLWKWVERLYKGLNVSVEYEVKVPESIKTFNIGNTAGNTTFSSIQGELKVKQNAGNITLDKVSLDGKSTFDMDAGNMIMDMNMDNASEVSIKGATGNINIKLPEKTALSLESRISAGNISGSFLSGSRLISGTLKQDFNGGGARLLVTLAAGNVTIDRK